MREPTQAEVIAMRMVVQLAAAHDQNPRAFVAALGEAAEHLKEAQRKAQEALDVEIRQAPFKGRDL